MSDEVTHDALRLRQLIDPSMVDFWDANLCNVIANSAHTQFFARTPEIRGSQIFELLIGDLG